jgi:hypothetical protein
MAVNGRTSHFGSTGKNASFGGGVGRRLSMKLALNLVLETSQ